MLALFEMKWPIYLWFSLMAFMVPLCIAPFVLYERETKSATMEKILSFWGNFKCSNIHTISEENIKKSKIFNFLDYYNQITIGDAFEGEYNKTKIYMDEKQIRTSIINFIFITLSNRRIIKIIPQTSLFISTIGNIMSSWTRWT